MTLTVTGSTVPDHSLLANRRIDPSILYLGSPVLLVSTRNRDGSANLAPISSSWWLGTTGVIGMGSRSHTVENLRREGECVLNIASVDLVTEVDRLALTTGSDPVPGYKSDMGVRHIRDKFSHAGLSQVASEVVSPPRVLECPIQLESNVIAINDIGPRAERTVAIETRVARTHVHESILLPGHRHHIDPNKWKPLIMNFLEFYGLGQQVHPSRLADVF